MKERGSDQQLKQFENEPPVGRFLLGKFDDLQNQVRHSDRNADFTWSDIAHSPTLLAKGAVVLAAYIAVGIPELALAQIKALTKDLYKLASQQHRKSQRLLPDEQQPLEP